MIDNNEYFLHKRSMTAEQVLDEELIMCELGTIESFPSPYDALQELINFHIHHEQWCMAQESEN